ncbi:MAG: ATP phosphoribosyltransferase [Pseudomonadota bacterium]
MTQPLIFAIPKGRILDDALPLLREVGIEPAANFFDKADRSLRFGSNRNDMDLIRVRAFDVATFVAHGAAHIGIVGSDVIDEFDYADLYAPVDLNFGHCRLSVAEPKERAEADTLSHMSHVRVATKYPNLTRRYFASLGVQAECVKLNGAMELAPSLGLAHHIVDLVESGRTLKQNGLEETAEIMPVSARLIVNRTALKTRHGALAPLIERFRDLAEAGKVAA